MEISVPPRTRPRRMHRSTHGTLLRHPELRHEYCGCSDDTSDTRLLLSKDADFDRVDGVRAARDAILIGGETLRLDNPRLLVNSARRRAE